MQKLVEKVAYLLSKHRFVSHDVRVVEADRDYAREIIRDIVSAFHNGRLDEELGVLDRTTLVRKKKGNRFWEATGFHPGFEGLEIRESQRTHEAILIALPEEEQP